MVNPQQANAQQPIGPPKKADKKDTTMDTPPDPVTNNEPTDEVTDATFSLRELSIDAPIEVNDKPVIRYLIDETTPAAIVNALLANTTEWRTEILPLQMEESRFFPGGRPGFPLGGDESPADETTAVRDLSDILQENLSVVSSALTDNNWGRVDEVSSEMQSTGSSVADAMSTDALQQPQQDDQQQPQQQPHQLHHQQPHQFHQQRHQQLRQQIQQRHQQLRQHQQPQQSMRSLVAGTMSVFPRQPQQPQQLMGAILPNDQGSQAAAVQAPAVHAPELTSPAGGPAGALELRRLHGQPHQARVFRPMAAKLNPDMKNRPLCKEEMDFRKAMGISENYRGETFNPQNISALIPDSENCSLFLTNLPPNCNYKELLAAVAFHKPGRIWQTVINSPDEKADPSLPSYRTSAAKIIFYSPHEANRLLSVASLGLFTVQGYRVHARRNRIRTPAQGPERSQTSRCIIISGPSPIVDELVLSKMFDPYFDYDTEDVVPLQEGENFRSLEWRFSSYRSQACSAFQLLRSQYSPVISVKFAQDPCAAPVV